MIHKILAHTQCFLQLEVQLVHVFSKSGSLFAEERTLQEIFHDVLNEVDDFPLELTLARKDLHSFPLKAYLSKPGDYDVDGVPVGVRYGLDVPLSLVRHLPLCRDGLYVTFVLNNGARNNQLLAAEASGVARQAATVLQDDYSTSFPQADVFTFAEAIDVAKNETAAVRTGNSGNGGETLNSSNSFRGRMAANHIHVISEEQSVVSTSRTLLEESASMSRTFTREFSHASDSGLSDNVNTSFFSIDPQANLETATAGFGTVTVVVNHSQPSIERAGGNNALETSLLHKPLVGTKTRRPIATVTGPDAPAGPEQVKRKKLTFENIARKPSNASDSNHSSSDPLENRGRAIQANLKCKRLFSVMSNEELKLLSSEDLKRCIACYKSIINYGRSKAVTKPSEAEMKMNEDFLKRCRQVSVEYNTLKAARA